MIPHFHACFWDIKRFRHFADWSVSSSEHNILKEIERGFIETFLSDISDEKLGTVFPLFLSFEWHNNYSSFLSRF